MKFNKDSFQIALLFFSGIGIMLSMCSMLFEEGKYDFNNVEIILFMVIMLVVLVIAVYIILISIRINPKKYIYLSYSDNDKDFAEKISHILNQELKKLSKYRFEIITKLSISFGDDIDVSCREYITKSDSVILIVSNSFLQSEWCQKELDVAVDKKKRIIPIVVDSFDDLSKLPQNLSNIKALSLINCISDEDIINNIKTLAKDIIRRQRD